MEGKEDEAGCVTLTWEIQNCCLLPPMEEGSTIGSPFWMTEHTDKRVWRRLRIFLYGYNIFFDLISAAECLHLDKCEVSLISSCMEIPLKLYYRDSDYWSYTFARDPLFGEKRLSILSNDTLTVRCKIFEKTMRTHGIHINSVLHSSTYHWNIEKFRPDADYSKYIEEENFLFKACLTSKSEKGTHAFILDEVTNVDRCVSPIYCKLSDKIGVLRVIEEIFEDKCNNRMYKIKIGLKNQRLDLKLESVFAVHKVCRDPFQLPSPPPYENASQAVSGALCDDFLLLYRNKLFSDVTLNAEGQSFPVHRNVLSSRSPIFRAMFEKNEMSEGREGTVDIDDVDSVTVDRMLAYMYGESFESVQKWEDASALYYAADKYDLKPLKHKCASSLKEGLTVHNACDALVLADRHSDDQLMKCIVDFLRQNEEVISSKKWDSFQISNPLLSSKILREMYLKVKKK